MSDKPLSDEKLNEILKENNPRKYREGWRSVKGKSAWTPTPTIIAKYAKMNAPCKICGHKLFTLKGVGVTVKPHWECNRCGILYEAKKKR